MITKLIYSQNFQAAKVFTPLSGSHKDVYILREEVIQSQVQQTMITKETMRGHCSTKMLVC